MLAATIEAAGCRLWGIELLSRGRHPTLRVYIDKDSAVTLEDCAVVSRQIGALLDVEDPIPGGYDLEVSSPGLDRLLFKQAHFLANLGRKVSVELWPAAARRRRLKGILQAVGDDMVTIDVDDGASGQGTDARLMTFEFADIKRARLVADIEICSVPRR